MKTLQLSITSLLCCLILLISSGCSTYRVKQIENHKKESATVWGWRVEKINPETYTLKGGARPLFLIASDPASDPKVAKSARNQLQNVMMGLSDKEVANHLSQVTGTQINVNMVLGSAALVTAGGASVAGVTTAKALAAATAGLTGAKSLFNEEVYRNALVQTLVASVISKRNEVRAQIELAQKKEVADYDMVSAINDVRQLHESGSFYFGLTLIREAAEAANNKRNAISGEAKRQELIANTETQKKKAIEAETERIDAETKKLKSTQALKSAGGVVQ